jgi:hypothetical protein
MGVKTRPLRLFAMGADLNLLFQERERTSQARLQDHVFAGIGKKSPNQAGETQPSLTAMAERHRQAIDILRVYGPGSNRRKSSGTLFQLGYA